MAAGIYKQGQGYWVRMMSSIAAGLVIAMGAAWLWDNLKTTKIGNIEPIYISATGAVLFMLVFSLIGFYLIGRKPKVVDFLIATEGEIKKVNWSTRREIVGSTWVVIGLTVFIALLCWVFDLVFTKVFQAMGVLIS